MDLAEISGIRILPLTAAPRSLWSGCGGWQLWFQDRFIYGGMLCICRVGWGAGDRGGRPGAAGKAHAIGARARGVTVTVHARKCMTCTTRDADRMPRLARRGRGRLSQWAVLAWPPVDLHSRAVDLSKLASRRRRTSISRSPSQEKMPRRLTDRYPVRLRIPPTPTGSPPQN